MKYYVAKKGLPIKGLTASKLQEMLAEGHLTGDDLVFSWKHDVWATISDLKIYQQYLQKIAEKRKSPKAETTSENIPTIGIPWPESRSDDSLIIDLMDIQDKKLNKTYGFETIDLADGSGSWDELETYYLPLGAEDSSSIHLELWPEESPSEEWFQQHEAVDVASSNQSSLENENLGSFHSGVIPNESLSEEWLQAFKDANMLIGDTASVEKKAQSNYAIINRLLSLLMVILVLILAGILATRRFS